METMMVDVYVMHARAYQQTAFAAVRRPQYTLVDLDIEWQEAEQAPVAAPVATAATHGVSSESWLRARSWLSDDV
jgi:hypothetical protein